MEESIKFDYLKLKFLIKAKYPKQELLANELNISCTSLSNKLNNRTPFAFDEVYTLIEKLGINDDEIKSVFFNKKC